VQVFVRKMEIKTKILLTLDFAREVCYNLLECDGARRALSEIAEFFCQRRNAMISDLQKASMGKRISAFLFDLIIWFTLVVGLAWAIFAIAGYDKYAAGYDAVREKCITEYEEKHGIELDIRFTKDKQLVVFHDDTLLRMCGVDQRVDAFTYAELQEFRLLDSDEQIPLFSEVLSLVNGRIPLLVEIKTGPENALLCQHAYDMLQTYQGLYCIESFHPMIVRWFKKHAPQILRGQLSAPIHAFDGALSGISAFLLSRLLTNVLARPHFIAYHKGKAALSVSLCQTLGAMRAVWTLRDTDYTGNPAELFETNDMIIFEFFRP